MLGFFVWLYWKAYLCSLVGVSFNNFLLISRWKHTRACTHAHTHTHDSKLPLTYVYIHNHTYRQIFLHISTFHSYICMHTHTNSFMLPYTYIGLMFYQCYCCGKGDLFWDFIFLSSDIKLISSMATMSGGSENVTNISGSFMMHLHSFEQNTKSPFLGQNSEWWFIILILYKQCNQLFCITIGQSESWVGIQAAITATS